MYNPFSCQSVVREAKQLQRVRGLTALSLIIGIADEQSAGLIRSALTLSVCARLLGGGKHELSPTGPKVAETTFWHFNAGRRIVLPTRACTPKRI
jgi:hypothetical protein